MKDLQLVPSHNQVKPPTRLNLVPGVTSESSERGQSLLEVLVAMAMAVIIVSGLAAVVIVAVKNAQFAKNQVLATKYANEGMEATRSIRDRDWVSFTNRTNAGLQFSGGQWSFIASPDTPATGFSRAVTIQDAGTDKKQVTVRVSWTDSIGTHKSELNSYFTKWK